jgi:cysteine desulfuration protein SufE
MFLLKNNMSEYPSKLEELLENLELTYDRDERIQMLIDIADRFKGVPDHIAIRPYPKSHLTPACESEAYVWSEALPNQSLRYHFAVENPQGISAKALAVILNETLSGEPVVKITQISTEVVYRIFGRELSMGKNMGLTSLLSMVQACARRYQDSGQADSNGVNGLFNE